MVEAGTIQQTIQHDGSVDAIAFSRDSKRLATGGGSTKVLIRAVEAGASVDIAVKGFVSSLAFSPVRAETVTREPGVALEDAFAAASHNAIRIQNCLLPKFATHCFL